MNPHNSYSPKGQPVEEVDRWYGQQLARRFGPAEAARIIGIREPTLARALLGLPVYASTAERFRRARVDAA